MMLRNPWFRFGMNAWSLGIDASIVVDKGEALAGMLRPGMSVEPTIDTKPPAGTASPARVP
jgi:hypothetical protein